MIPLNQRLKNVSKYIVGDFISRYWFSDHAYFTNFLL
jgi:hypothetical protein